MALRLDALPSPADFAARRPFPWVELPDALSADRFDELRRGFPDLRLFDHHVGRPRPHGQRPHDRHYLAFEQSVHGRSGHGGPGVVHSQDLDESWRQFITELRSTDYLGRMRDILQVDDLVVRFAWHIGTRGSEVSPHRDAPMKLGTHLFYFNTAADWEVEWGGATELLAGQRSKADNPDFEDFDECVAIQNLATSLLFANRPQAWHGVRPLDCPATAKRRLFTVVFDGPRPRRTLRNLFGRAAGSQRR